MKQARLPAPAMTDHDPELPDFTRIPDPWRPPVPPMRFEPPRRAPAEPTRSELARGRRTALFVAGGSLVAQLAVSGIRGDLQRVPFAYTVAFGVAPTVAGLWCVAAAVSPGRLGLGVRVRVLATMALVLPLGFTLLGYALSPPYSDAAVGSLEHGVFCFNIAAGWTMLPFVAAGLVLRRSFVTRAGWRSALVGAGAGLTVATTSFLRCSLSDGWHVALGHGGAVIASALLGAFVLARVTRV